ncbi:MAG: C40 family peptidase [Daejeonella sp.]
MKRLLCLISLLLVFKFQSHAGIADSAVIKRVNELAAQVQKKHAPDKRTEYFQINIQNNEPLSILVEASRPEALTDLRLLLNKEKIAVTIKEQVLPAADMGENTYGVANLSVSNNRYSPEHAAEMATQSILGTPVKILKKERGYYFVRTPDNYLSYTESAGITPMNKAEFEAWQASEKIIYTDIYGQAYSEGSETSLPVSDLVSGNILQLLGQSNGFYKVSFPDKRIAYVPVKKAQQFSQWQRRPNPDAEEILKSARTMLGIPYLWGGTSTKGVDCSGFTKTSYFLNGIVLPRDASQQALVGEKVDIYEADTVNITKSLKNLKPGDLLFFASDKKTLRVTHTALYIGNGEFIQAAGLVRINSMVSGADNYADFQSRTLVSARRMLTSIGKPEITRVDQHPYYTQTAE